MRQIYEISDETRAVLTDHVKAVASEMDVNDSYLYQILSGVGSDCFAKFRRLYAACVRAGVDVSPWDASFGAIKTRHVVGQTPTCSLSEKITSDARTTQKMVDALKDGVIDECEAPAIRKAIQKERDILDVIEAQLVCPGTVREFARGAVASRRAK